MVLVIRRDKDHRIQWLDVIICLALILSPILQQHKGFFVNGGWSALVIGLPFCLIRYLSLSWRGRKSVVVSFFLIMAYYGWTLFDHGFSSISVFKIAILFVYYLAVTREDFSFRYVINIASFIVLAACICVVAQYICNYLFHYRLQFLSVNTLLSEDSRWYSRISSVYYAGSFYRPSAFFLEPSHMFIFSFPVALYKLFSSEADKKSHTLGLIMLAGIVLSTSGMGIVFSGACVYVFYTMYKNPHFRKGSLKNLLSLKAFLILLFGVGIIVFLYYNVDLVYKAIVRIISENESGYNAIAGRTSAGVRLIRDLSGRQFIIGVTDAMGSLGSSLSGFQATLYKFGIIGIALSYLFYIYAFLNVSGNYRIMCLILLVISFVCAHTHNYFYMLYYSVFIFEGLKTHEYTAAIQPRQEYLQAAQAVTLDVR